MYTPDHWEILAEVNSVACITIISLIFGRKLASIEGPIHYARGLILFLYGLSWAFTLISCMLTSTNNGNFVSCVMTQFNVALIATSAKIALYLYFAEKAYILSVPKCSRLHSNIYLVSLGLVIPSFATIVLQIFFRINVVAEDYPFHCTVGLELPASIFSLIYDVVVNLAFACIFLKFYYFPTTTQQTAHQSNTLPIMAIRNFIITIISLVTLGINYVLLIVFSGYERGLVASSSTALALTILCSALQWVTTHPAESQWSEKALQRANADKLQNQGIIQVQEVVIRSEFNKA
ncbi:hypothetical protein BY458DRAFT_456754 [Sporodiniella umbellata]|nr:hypothetical protein BY458DRAFT_456754 [Sporodiniella umbellata]